jgi:sec-independent protein translocase protein TatB
VFGFSFGELLVLAIVAMVVIGPKDLPRVLRKAGQLAGRLRRMASDIRSQSGIDDVLRHEGIADDLNEIRRLARGEIDAVARTARIDLNGVATAAPAPAPDDPYAPGGGVAIARERECPREGPDAYGALADTAVVYAAGLIDSPLARDPLYFLGDPDAPRPAPASPPAAPEANPEPRATPPEAPGAADTEPAHHA